LERCSYAKVVTIGRATEQELDRQVIHNRIEV
jgi:hypothetical protein